ncbi:hypothetical protein FS749_000395 [Ceratobasidium sp. UAMH 11750]|nr:hypothetical protein FS749_000395 [Ceratobasidium sp. UAMH 11750]
MQKVAEVEEMQRAQPEPGPIPIPEPTPVPDTNMEDPEPEVEPKPGLGDALRTVLKAEKEAEKKKRREERGKLMKPSSPAKSKIGKRGREGGGTGRETGKEKKARSAPPPPQPVFISAKLPASPGKASSTQPPSPGKPLAQPTSPKRSTVSVVVPVTPRSLHPAAQRAKARHYAPAVPSPLSRILSMAASPEGREDVPEAGPSRLSGGGVKSPGRGAGVKSPPGMGGGANAGVGPKSPGRSGGSKSPGRPKSGLAVKFAEAAAKAKTKETKEPRVLPLSETEVGRAGTSKGKERAREEEEREKDEGRDLDAIFAPRPGPSAGPRAGTVKSGAGGKPMRVAVKRGATPRKAAVGGVRAKRAAAWRG